MPSSPLGGRRILLGVSGGIAAYKACILARLLVASGARVDTILTGSAERFIGAATFAGLTGGEVHTSLWDDPAGVPHVRLAHGADLVIVAPATAHLLARVAAGMADDLLTSVLLETDAPVLIAPAMHSGMWENAATRGNVDALSQRGVRFVGPVEGALAAGDEGVGRLAEPDDILRAAEDLIARGRDLAGRRVLVTAGPTHEPIDAVRFIGNRSSGRMGFAVARAARDRGAEVTLVVGPTDVAAPEVPHLVRVETAAQMRDAVLARVDQVDAIVMAAAVADFRPERAATSKHKKAVGAPELRLVPTEDILGLLGARERRPILVGFAAETGSVEDEGRRKLVDKRLDLVIANLVGAEGTGFGSDTDDAAILSPHDDDVAMRRWAKSALADAICDRLAKLLIG